jgi:3-deoxy-D-manno-octulosonic-acid transferase
VRFIYNILFSVFFVLSAPYYFLKMWRRVRAKGGSWTEGFGQRFGTYDSRIKQAITNRQVLWMHAVSVGEVNVLTQLIHALEPRLPNIKIVVSTTTSTGMELLQQMLPTHISKIYYPIDRRSYVSRALSTIRPKAVVLVEAEIWPNFIWRLQELRVPLFLVNARLSERSFPRYRKFSALFRPLFSSFTGVGTQNDADATKLRELGCRPETIHVVGSLKFDAAKLDEKRLLDVPHILEQLGVPANALLLVAGSTHSGEEAMLAEQYLRLRQQFPTLFLILVPRHFERGKEVGKELDARGVKFVYRSEITASTRMKPGEIDCLLVNTTGELKYFYEHADVIFVGKSLRAQGGQNPIEPGALGKAMIFGPNMQNFADIARTFISKQGAVQVNTEAELEKTLAELLANEARRDELGQNARKVVRENLGAINRTVDMIVQNLSDQNLYIREHA